MARLRGSCRTSLSAPQQPWNPHPESRARNPYYTWTKSVLQQRGLVKKAGKRSAHRKKRARRPLPGLLLFQDGSKPAWLPQGPELDLIVTMDDSTSAIL